MKNPIRVQSAKVRVANDTARWTPKKARAVAMMRERRSLPVINRLTQVPIEILRRWRQEANIPASTAE